MASVTISSAIKKEIEDRAKEKAKFLAMEFRDSLAKYYLSIIATFYSEYEPIDYARHFNNDYSEMGLLKSGLGHTFKKVYKNKGNGVFTGGILISTSSMFNDYYTTSHGRMIDRRLDVLNTFLIGSHGLPPTKGMKIKHINTTNLLPSPYELILTYKEDLKKDIIKNAKI